MSFVEAFVCETGLAICGARVGHVVDIDASGRVVVDFEGNPAGPVAARVAFASASGAHAPARGAEVVLVFEHADPAQPLIVGVLREGAAAASVPPAQSRLNEDAELVIDGRAIKLDACEEITLRCGAASVTLRADGRILLRGVDITSRASGINKIKGGAVRIN